MPPQISEILAEQQVPKQKKDPITSNQVPKKQYDEKTYAKKGILTTTALRSLLRTLM